MNILHQGEFYGETNQTTLLDGLTLTDTVYTHDKVDWHYHEHAYFTFILQGNVLEGNKKGVCHCPEGTLLFHYWQDPHYNIKPKGFTRGFHVEVHKDWFDQHSFNEDKIQGTLMISEPAVKLLMYKIFAETKLADQSSAVSIQVLLLHALSRMSKANTLSTTNKPKWVNKVKEILNDRFADQLSLQYLSSNVDIHPAHLSRDFSKYFNCSFGEYMRQLKVTRSLSLLSNKKKALSDITFECGFADQSHFNRCFKNLNGLTPSAYRKLLFS